MGGNMKAWIVAMAAWLCWTSVTVGSTRVCYDRQIKATHYLNKLHSSDLTFFIDDPSTSTYSKFLRTLREKLTCYDLEKYDLPVLCTESDVQGSMHFLVDLSYNNVPVTLALNVVNLNLEAYKSESRSYFFANTDDLRSELFTETEQAVMPFTNSYKSLGSRTAVEIGMSVLRNAHQTLSNYASTTDQSKIKSSLMIVIEMVSEAARLKLVENTINNNFDENIRPSSKMISYMDQYEELSKEIQRAKNGRFSHAIELRNENDIAFRVTSVGQVQANMGILKYYPPLEEYAVA